MDVANQKNMVKFNTTKTNVEVRYQYVVKKYEI